MARVCDVTGKKTTTGNNVSHANNRTRRKFLPNLQSRKFWVESENRWVSMKISSAALRTIDKLGIDEVLNHQFSKHAHILARVMCPSWKKWVDFVWIIVLEISSVTSRSHDTTLLFITWLRWQQVYSEVPTVRLRVSIAESHSGVPSFDLMRRLGNCLSLDRYAANTSRTHHPRPR